MYCNKFLGLAVIITFFLAIYSKKKKTNKRKEEKGKYKQRIS